MPEEKFLEVPYPISRQLTFDVGEISAAKHRVLGLLEVDVTDAWNIILQSRKSARKINFTAWLIKTLADCVADHPEVAGINQRRRSRLLVFEDIHVGIAIEREVNGKPVPLAYLIREAQRKSVFEIQDEIETARLQEIKDEGDYVLGGGYSAFMLRMYMRLPQWLRLPIFRKVFIDDVRLTHRSMGSVMVTTVGMLGHTQGWIVPYGIQSLCLAFGSLNDQPRVHKGEIAVRRVLHLTTMIDHDVVDGMPAARFVDDLVRRFESARGLEEASQR